MAQIKVLFVRNLGAFGLPVFETLFSSEAGYFRDSLFTVYYSDIESRNIILDHFRVLIK